MKLNWQKIILYITVIGIEGCWLYASTAFLNNKTAGGLLSVKGILLIYLLAFFINLLLNRLHWHKYWLGSISWLLWVIVLLVTVKVQLAGSLAWTDTAWLLSVPRAIADVIYTFKPELLVMLLSAVMWWLGRRMSRLKITFGTAFSEFQFGLIILVLIFFIASMFKTGMGNPVPLALVFFLLALVGISVAHALEGTSWLAGLYRGHWSGLLLLSIGVILVLGLVISAIVTPDILNIVWTAIKWLAGIILGLIMLILNFFASIFPASEPQELPEMPAMPAIVPDEGEPGWVMPEWLRVGLRIGWMAMIIGFLIFALWRISSDIFKWLRRKQAGTGDAEFKPVRGGFRADLLSLFKRIISWIKRLFLPRTRPAPVQAEIATVLQIYRQFLRWAASTGHSRQVSQTPYEFSGTLVKLIPEAVTDINLVTQEYVKARYGAWVSSQDELNELTMAWYRVKRSSPDKRIDKRTRKKEEN
jgi:hypothetical protein